MSDKPVGGAEFPLSKVPQVALAFWVAKILATTLGETGGDALSMTLDLGYAVISLIFLGFFAVTLAAQMKASRYHPILYWAVVVATTTVGPRRPITWTALSDWVTSNHPSRFCAWCCWCWQPGVSQPARLPRTTSPHATMNCFIGSRFWFPTR